CGSWRSSRRPARSTRSPRSACTRPSTPWRRPDERARERINKHCAPANAADERRRGGGMSPLPAVVPPQAAEKDLARRLDALAELVKISKPRTGADGFSSSLIDDSEALLRRAGERLRLSGSHTVAALAGGTGSGKSTLFNALAGAMFSPPGVTRPTTRHV